MTKKNQTTVTGSSAWACPSSQSSRICSVPCSWPCMFPLSWGTASSSSSFDSHLHTPMCLFLSNWSFSDLCFYFITMPTSLQNMQSQVPSIP